MPSDEEVEDLLHRVRSTLARLRYEIELMDSLADRPRVLETIDELRDMLRARVAPGSDAPVGALGINVTVVDDDARLGRLIAAMLRRRGFTAGWQVDLPASVDPSVVLVADWGVLRSHLVTNPNLVLDRVVIMSGGSPDGHLARLNDPPVLLKPFDDAQLVAAVLLAARGQVTG